MSEDLSQFLNRELSWLEFNERVLSEARDPQVPLLERVRYFQIFASNLDEFFMKRVGGLKRQVLARVPASGIESQSPVEQLREIRARVQRLLADQSATFTDMLAPGLDRAGLKLVLWSELEPDEMARAETYFARSVLPVLTPLAVDPGHPFPFISNLSASFGVLMAHPDEPEKELFARVKVPFVLPTWVRVDDGEVAGVARFVSLFELIGQKMPDLFPGMLIRDMMTFRVTRNADIEREEEDAEDLLEMIADELRERRFARAVRLEHGPVSNPRILSILMDELEIEKEDVYELPLWLEHYFLQPLLDMPRPELKFQAWSPVAPPALSTGVGDIFSQIRRQDILVHHPYESFGASVERFIREAADDPKVLAVKMTLYRTGADSPFVPLLIRAAESGKQAACLVELKARFDEERNMRVAQELEKAGVHVVYGVVGLKTHSKVALVVRQEEDGVRCYAHLGTGNYHAGTSKLYTDLGLFTADPLFTDDVVHLFHFLTGRSLRSCFRKLLIAPIDMKETFARLIDREIEHAKAGLPTRIVAKMNSLEDREICAALYRASKAGVKIDLIVRGVCCLKPGVPGLSENIRVISVVGRFLEHSRVFYFSNGRSDALAGDFFIGSADWMYRNLMKRVEAVAPVESLKLKERIWDILATLLGDTEKAWRMHPDGTYSKPPFEQRQQGSDSQRVLMRKASESPLW